MFKVHQILAGESLRVMHSKNVPKSIKHLQFPISRPPPADYKADVPTSQQSAGSQINTHQTSPSAISHHHLPPSPPNHVWPTVFALALNPESFGQDWSGKLTVSSGWRLAPIDCGTRQKLLLLLETGCAGKANPSRLLFTSLLHYSMWLLVGTKVHT